MTRATRIGSGWYTDDAEYVVRGTDVVRGDGLGVAARAVGVGRSKAGRGPPDRRAVVGPASRLKLRLPICIQGQLRSQNPRLGHLARPQGPKCQFRDTSPGQIKSGGRAEIIE